MFQGLFTALITPFTKQNTLDEEGLRFLIQCQIDAKVDGIVLLGTTGESPTVTEEEHHRILKIGVEACKGKIKLLAGTGCNSTQETIKHTQYAQKVGCDGALIVAPYYNKPTQEGLYKHFEAIHNACHFPTLVYNILGRTGVNIETHTLKKIANLPSVVGVKEASGNLSQMMDVLAQLVRDKKPFSVLSGDDNLTFPLMTLGGHGVISVASNLIPVEMVQLIRFLQSGDYASARALHFKWLSLFKTLFIETNPGPIKAAMNFRGLPGGSCRLPLCEMSEYNQQVLLDMLQENALISVNS